MQSMKIQFQPVMGRRWTLCLLSLMVLIAGTRAFSTRELASRARYSYIHKNRASTHLNISPNDNKSGRSQSSPIFASDTKVIELPPESVENSSSQSAPIFQQPNPLINLQLQSFDKDTIINLSIVTIAIVLVAIQVFTVNTGITRGWTVDEIAYRVPIDNWRSYNDILNMAPIQTKAVTSATVYTIGDVIAQRTEGVEIGELDRGRIGRSLAAGLLGHGPLSHVWYQVSEDWFENVFHWTEWWSFVPKVAVDQTLWGPFWNNTYIVMLGIMQFQKPSQIWADIKRTTIPLVVSGLKLWPLAHCVTYGLVPVENRLLWVDIVEIVWVTILATQASGAADAKVEEKAEGV